jgi:pimeloyl-ACP methyl ester carboxylesterase
MHETREFAQHRFEYANDAFLNYEVHGSGPQAVVFLHGFGASLDSWNDIKPLLPQDGFTHYFIDLKGFGLSSKPRDGRYSMVEQARLVTAFMDHHRLDDVVLVGQSYGGAVALVLAVQAMWAGQPSRVGKLVLISSAAYPQKHPSFIQILRTPILNWAVFKLVPARHRILHTHRRIFYSTATITQERVARYMRHASTPHARYSFTQVARQLVPPDQDRIVAAYKELAQPSLLIWGEHDPVIPLELGRRLAEDLPNADLRILSECGHVPQEELPEQTADLIAEFLRAPRCAQ